jgi:hypothetical protein
VTAIRIPHRGDPGEPLLSVIDSARVLPLAERAVARQVALNLTAAGIETVGEALSHLQAATPAERRVILHDAEKAAGVPDTSAAESMARHMEQSRQMFVAGADDPELRFEIGPTGWVDPDARELERAQAHAEAIRRALELARRREARLAELPALEAEETAEARYWVGANMLPEGAP